MSTPFRIVSTAMILLFITAMAVQYNDPDGVMWMGVYGLAALLTVLAMTGHNTAVAPVASLGYFLGGLWVMPRSGANWLEIEQGREAVGLFITAVWCAALGVHWYRRRRPLPRAVPEAEASSPEE